MDVIPAVSPKLDGCRSSPSIPQPVMPSPPLQCLDGDSSLVVAHIAELPPNYPTNIEQQSTPRPAASHIQSRSLSNIGKKRTAALPLARPAATPGHVPRMQRIFQDAKASLQLDSVTAGSPRSRRTAGLSATGTARSNTSEQQVTSFGTVDWTPSSPLRTPAEISLKAEGSQSIVSPDLPVQRTNENQAPQSIAHEATSSGFTSPIVPNGEDVTMHDQNPVICCPFSSPHNKRPSMSPRAGSSYVQATAHSMIPAELEQPLRRMRLGHADSRFTAVVPGSVNVHAEAEGHASAVEFRDLMVDKGSADDAQGQGTLQDVVLPVPVKAAAEAAKLKRKLLGRAVRPCSKIETWRSGSPHASGTLCHHDLTTNSFHPGTALGSRQVGCRPRSFGSPPPCSMEAEQSLPALPSRRVNSSGSPLPTMEGSCSQAANQVKAVPQWQHYKSSPSKQQFASPPSEPQTSPLSDGQRRAFDTPLEPYQIPLTAPEAQGSIETFTEHEKYSPTAYSETLSRLFDPRVPPPSAETSPRSKPSALPHRCHPFNMANRVLSDSGPTDEAKKRTHNFEATQSSADVSTIQFGPTDPRIVAHARSLRKYYPATSCRVEMEPLDSESDSSSIREPSGITSSMGRNELGGSSRKAGRKRGSLRNFTFRSSPPRPAASLDSPGARPRRKKVRRSLSQEDVSAHSTERGKETALGTTKYRDAMMLGHGDAVTPMNVGGGHSRSSVGKETVTTARKTPTVPITPDQIQCFGLEGEREAKELSPYVTPYRKKRRPRVRDSERRPSYWDQDILPIHRHHHHRHRHQHQQPHQQDQEEQAPDKAQKVEGRIVGEGQSLEVEHGTKADEDEDRDGRRRRRKVNKLSADDDQDKENRPPGSRLSTFDMELDTED